jgi:hypothetical protein
MLLADEILRIEKGEMRTMASRTFREGFMGKSLEDGLQELIEKYPAILPGRQIAPGREDPPRFMLLCREMAVGSWSLDFLLVDQDGILTLAEAKLVENPESRRAVIGQIAEYAANAADNWLGGHLLEKTTAYYHKKGLDLEEAIKSLTGDEGTSIDDFFSLIESNLLQGKLRLIVITDQLRPEVRKIIEYLNTETKNIEILGLEISFYGDTDDSFVLVPTIVGQSQQISDKKGPTDRAIVWDYSLLISAYDELDNRILAERLSTTAAWARETGVFIPGKGHNPSFGIKGKHGRRILTFSEWGVYSFLNRKSHGDSIEDRDDFVKRLNELSIFDYTEQEIAEAKEGKNSKGDLAALTEQDFKRFIEIMSELTR